MALSKGDRCLFGDMASAKIDSILGDSVRFTILHKEDFRQLFFGSDALKFMEFKSESGVNYQGVVALFEETGQYNSICMGFLELDSVQVIENGLMQKLKQAALIFLRKIKIIKR